MQGNKIKPGDTVRAAAVEALEAKERERERKRRERKQAALIVPGQCGMFGGEAYG